MNKPIHASEISEWKKCRIAHKWKYKERRYPMETPIQLEIGTAFHAAMAVYYDPETYETKSANERFDLAVAEFERVNTVQCTEALETLASPFDYANIKDDYDARVILGKDVLTQWHRRDRFDFEERLTPVFVEHKLEYELSEGCVIEGRLDGIFKDKHTGKVWVIDWKHVTSLKPEIEVRLDMDEQINMYMLLATLNGFDVAGFKYVERVKGTITTPELLGKRYRGRLFSVNKNQITDYDTALAAIKELDAEAYEKGLYDEFLNYLKHTPPQLTRITTLYRKPAAIQNYYSELKSVIAEMRSDYNEFGANGFVCQWCVFKQACNERVRGGDWEAMLEATTEVKKPYYEREI